MGPIGENESVTESTPVRGRVLSRARELSEPPEPRAFLESADSPRLFWSGPETATIVGSGAAAIISASGEARFGRVRQEATQLFEGGDVHAGSPVARPRLFGGFAFDSAPSDDELWDGYPGARFVLPAEQVSIDEDGTWLTVNVVDEETPPTAVEERLEAVASRLSALPEAEPPADRPGVSHRERVMAAPAWRASVADASGRIRDGELSKVVLAQEMRTELGARPATPDILTRLGQSHPHCTQFLFEPPDSDGRTGFLGATPEQLIGLRGRTVETEALAGTTGRGDTLEEDEWLATELLDDEKNRHEHSLVVETIRTQLAPFAGSLSTGDRRVRRLATIQHLETPITAELEAKEHVLTLVEALHPTPAVGGLPPAVARETIRETERFDRGWYAAPIGWFDAAGYGSFAVALRSGLIRGERATLFAGVGIVGDSDPDREADEIELKYRPLLDELE